MEKNGKAKKFFWIKEKKHEDNKKYKKTEAKEKEGVQTKEIGRKKQISKISQHQLKGNVYPLKNKSRSYKHLDMDHQTMELESNFGDENEDDVESEEEEDFIFTTKASHSNKLSKAPKNVRKFFHEEAKEAISDSEESEEEKSNLSDDDQDDCASKENDGKFIYLLWYMKIV